MKNVLVYNTELTFLDLLRKMDSEGNGFLILVKEDNTLLGIITDGDVRRAILNNKHELYEIINSNPVVALKDMNRSDAIKFLKKIHKKQIPIVDENNRLVNVYYIDDKEGLSKPNYVVVMAGGLGLRLGELTKEIPKPMLKVAGKPILENLIRIFSETGFNNFIFCINYKSEIIKDYFGSGKKWNVNIHYIEEQEQLGTAGALGLIDINLDFPFFVINGDLFTTAQVDDFLNFHYSKKSYASMCVKKYDYQMPYACININEDSKIINIEEKPIKSELINTGLYIFNPDVLKNIPKDQYLDMPNLFEKIIRENRSVFSYLTDDYWIDIGHINDYHKVNNDLKLLI